MLEWNSSLLTRKQYLDGLVQTYNHPRFIATDPIQVPKKFLLPQDIEIAGLIAATLAWGNRKSIISSASKAMRLMGERPYDFVMNMGFAEARYLEGFVHRTFNATDLRGFLFGLQQVYREYTSLDALFGSAVSASDSTMEQGLLALADTMYSAPEFEKRTRKHLASPAKKSACKRLCMFLRWMVRKDEAGVDFGLWKSVKTSQLVCPLDVHVEKYARALGLLSRKQSDWLAALELTERLKEMDPLDPVKYDFALFGLGALGLFEDKEA